MFKKTYFTLAGLLAFAGMATFGACASETEPETASSDLLTDEGGKTGSLNEDDAEELASRSDNLTKGTPGATMGSNDYCNGAQLCTAGEGDCDLDSQCASGLICGMNIGARYGLPEGHDVCVAPHCLNGKLDGNETAIDRGGSCGAATCPGLQYNGANNYCSISCPCAARRGDCDSNAECATGNVCGQDIGLRFGFAASTDVCVPPHCLNGVRDGNETGIDSGGSCGNAACPGDDNNGANDFCSVSCKCAAKQSDCDNDSECVTGTVCVENVGARFGFPGAHDVCLAAHCRNRVKDGAETGIDCGDADCGACPPLATA